MTKAGPIVADRLKSFVERIEKMEEERRAAGEDIRDIYKEASGVGYDKGAIQWIVRERRLDAADRQERDGVRAAYAHALGMAVEAVRNGMSYREAEEAFGFSKSAIHRASHSTRDSASGTAHREMDADDLGEWLPPHDADTGELPREMTADDLGDPLLVIDKPRAEFKAKVRAIAASVRVPERVEEPPPSVADDIDMDAAQAAITARRRALGLPA